MVIENVDSSSDIQQRSAHTSRQLSIVSVASEDVVVVADDKNKNCDNDDVMEDLLYRIKKQRSDLENILGIERKASEELSKNQLHIDDKVDDDDDDKKGLIEGTTHPLQFFNFNLIILLYSISNSI